MAVVRADGIHPEVQKAMTAIENPKVKAIARELSKYGLAIAVPHLHNDEGEFLPLPANIVAHEAGLTVSFVDREDARLKNAIPVMWRWDCELQSVAWCSSCSGGCCIVV